MKTNAVSGILLLDKPAGVTSFSALAPVKKLLHSKTGHAGTLDKFAEGLLVVLLGACTKLNPLFSSLDKTYEAVFTFGEETATLDPEGEIVLTAPVPELSVLDPLLSQFTGSMMQVPPAYSAVHVNGKRAYAEARKGREPVIPPRQVYIEYFRMLNWDPPRLRAEIRCSKGTYIRSLARDLGRAAGSAAHVSELKRTAVGPYSLSEAGRLEEVSFEQVHRSCRFFSRLPSVSAVTLESQALKKLCHGVLPACKILLDPQELERSPEAPRYCLLCTPEGETAAVALMEIHGNTGVPASITAVLKRAEDVQGSPDA
jgi:tRNA pseudouridine55 synthase